MFILSQKMFPCMFFGIVIVCSVVHIFKPPWHQCTADGSDQLHGFPNVLLSSPTCPESMHKQTLSKLSKWSILPSKKGTNMNNLYLSLLLVTLSHDVQVNPGPRPPKYPCGHCGKAVGWKQEAIQCDSCETWFHRVCTGMDKLHYQIHIEHESYSWPCLRCGLPNFNSSYFDHSLSFLSDPNMYSILDVSEPDFNMTSTPKKVRNKKSPKNKARKLKLLNINLRCIMNKIGEFHALVDYEKPDVVIGTETWLSPDICSSEFLPDGFNLFREDRKGTQKRSGGVFIMVSKTLICSHEPQFTVDCEIIWNKLQVTGAKPYYIGAYYRPHESDEHSLLELRKSLEKVRAHSGTILLIGDLNLPKLDWKTDAPTILPSC